ncbi:MAG TPA: pitrilysin family protein [Bryobacteraceae bacterium]|nr:pitrilysin family protein [Bryobacteraceae bacterium]
MRMPTAPATYGRLVALMLTAAAAWGQATVGPAHIPDTPAAYRNLTFPPLKSIPVPDVTTYTLPNGLKIYLLEDHELPIVSAMVRVRTGSLFEPADKVGLASVTGTVMRTGGTQNKTGDQLDEELENIAASVETDIGESSGSVSFSALKENTDAVLGIFKDVLTAPAFRQDKIDLALSEMRSGIARRNDDAHGIADREFSDIVYGKDTPYGWQLEYATLDNIKRADIVAFYQRYFFPANMLMAVWGDFSTAEMQEKLTKLLGDWNYTQPRVPPFPPVREQAHPGIYLAKKDDVTQTFFSEGHLSGQRNDKDYPALEVMADILGGGFQSRLMERVRTQLGLAYDISADWSANYDHPGLFEIAGSTKSASTADTLKAVKEQIDRIRAAEVTSDELETARQTALNGLVFAFDTKTKTLGRVLNYEYYGYPKDFIDRFQKGLEAVTRADVLRAAQQRVRPADLTIVAVGKTDEFQQSLATLGLPVSSIDLTIPEPKSAPKAAAPASAADTAKARQLLARVQQAAGGADKLAAVKDMLEVAEFHVDPSMGGATMRRMDRWIAPSYFREDTTLPFGTVSIYGDGKTGWMSSPQGQAPLPPAQLKPVEDKLLRLYFPMLLSDRLPGRTVNLAGDNTLDISDGQGSSVRLFIDETTNLPAKVEYNSPAMKGPPSAIEETYEEFADVDGMKLPKRLTITQNGHKYADVVIESVKLNTGLKPDDLSKKP